jgi:hypothetical protein
MTMAAQMQHLAQAYFHQDYDLEFADPDEAVAAFARGEGRGAVRELDSEIEALLASPLNESELVDLWVKTLGAAYDPTVHGQTARGWLSHVRERLAPMQDNDEEGST